MKVLKSLTLLFTLVTAAPASAALVGVDFGGGTTPTNWNILLGGDNPLTLTNLIDETGAPTTIDLEVNGAVGNDAITTFGTPNAATVPTHTQSLSGIDNGVGDAGGLSIVLSSLVPNASYELYIFGGPSPFVFAHDVTVTHGGAPIVFAQAPANNDLWINGSIGTNAQLDTFALTVTATPAGTITITTTSIQSGTELGGIALQQILAAAIIPEPATASLGLLALAGLTLRRRRMA